MEYTGTLAASGLTVNHNSDFSTITITGTPNHTYAGLTKKLHIVATNSHNKSNDAYINLVYRGLPLRNNTTGVTQSLEQGQAITAVNLANYFSNPANSGSLIFSDSEQGSITVTAPGSSTSTFANSALAKAGSAGNKLSLRAGFISGTLPNNLAKGTYVIAVHGENTLGFSTGQLLITLNVSSAGSPAFTGLPQQLLLKQGTLYSASTPAIDLTQYVTPGSGTVTSITASLASGSLAAAGLSYSDTTHEITGTYNGTYAGTQKTLTITATNSKGNSTTANLPIQFAGLPVRNQATTDKLENLEQGQTMPAVDLSTFFTNPANYNGSISFNASNQSSIKVVLPNDTVTTLAASPLAANSDVTLTGTSIAGKIPNNLPGGTYSIDFFAKNDVGYAVQKGTIILNINHADQPAIDLPSTVNVVYNHAYTTSSPLLNIASNLQPGNTGGSITSSSAKLKTGSLSDIGLQTNPASGDTVTSIIGTFNQASERGTTRTLVVSAGNNADKFVTKDITLQLVAAPAYNDTAPSAQTHTQGSAITDVNLASSFTNFANSGDLSFNAADSGSISVKAPDGNVEPLSLSPLGGLSNSLHLSGNTLTGTIPTSATPGAYTISFKAKNSIGFAATAASFTLTVTASQAPSFSASVPATLSADQGHSYTSSSPLLNLTLVRHPFCKFH